MPELTGNNYRSFLSYFSTSYPELRNKFPQEFVWSLGAPHHGMKKPQSMSDLDFDTFREIEFRWLIKNGFIQVPRGHVSFILPQNGFTTIEPKEILRLEGINSNTTKLYLREQGYEHSLNVFGSLESIQDKIGTTL